MWYQGVTINENVKVRDCKNEFHGKELEPMQM